MNGQLRHVAIFLATPASRSVWLLVAAACALPFLLAVWTFHFPLSYCDSPAWSVPYVELLLGQESVALPSHRARLARAWFGALGQLALWFGSGSAIGLVQALATAAALLAVSRALYPSATRIALLLAPALFFSSLRYAIYSQTILSEPLAMPLFAIVWIVLLQRRVSLPASVAAGVAAALLLHLRADTAYLLPLLALRLGLGSDPIPRRVLRLALASAAGLAALLPLARTATVEDYPLAKVMILAEWIRYTEPPRNMAAQALDFDFVSRADAAVAGHHPLHHIYDGLGPSQKIMRSADAPSWPQLARFVAYQMVNAPVRVTRERLATLWDLYATGYAAMWPEYRAASAYYSSYDAVFSRWSADDIDGAAYSCPGLAKAQAQKYQRPAIRSRATHVMLQWLHRAGGVGAVLLLRPLTLLALPLALFALWRRASGDAYCWLSAILAAHLLLRALLVCADERYQLPVDILCVWWLALTLSSGARMAAGSSAVGPRILGKSLGDAG